MIKGSLQGKPYSFSGKKTSRAAGVVLVFPAEFCSQEGLLPWYDENSVQDKKSGRKEKKRFPSGEDAPSGANEAVAHVEGISYKGVRAPCDQPFSSHVFPPVPGNAPGCPKADGLADRDENETRRQCRNRCRTRQEKDSKIQGSPEPAPELESDLPDLIRVSCHLLP